LTRGDAIFSTPSIAGRTLDIDVHNRERCVQFDPTSSVVTTPHQQNSSSKAVARALQVSGSVSELRSESWSSSTWPKRSHNMAPCSTTWATLK
jgi:hypothetical protein